MELKDGIKQINQSVSQSSASDATLEGYMLELKDANGNLVDKQPVSKIESLVYNYLTTKRQSELAKVMSVQDSLGGANDNVFIMFHRKSDNSPLIVKPSNWASYQSSGEIATGVAVVDGERILVVAPTETSAYWSSAAVSGGDKTAPDRLTALGDFDGKANTAAQITHPECSGANYAAGYCALYSRTNANGQGLTAGNWWLPSMGELMTTYSNIKKINYALSLIEGATQLVETWYWSGTEYSATYAWGMYFDEGFARSHYKTSHSGRVRPVSSISLNLPSFYKDYATMKELEQGARDANEVFFPIQNEGDTYYKINYDFSAIKSETATFVADFYCAYGRSPLFKYTIAASKMTNGVFYTITSDCPSTVRFFYNANKELFIRSEYGGDRKILSVTGKVTSVEKIGATPPEGLTEIPLSNGYVSYMKDYPDIASLAGGVSLQPVLAGVNDNVFIMFHRKSDNYPLMVKPDKWASYQNSGEIAEGVVVVEGGRILVVAPTETSAHWSSAAVSAGGKTTTDRLTALGDFDGKASTASQITHSEASGASYAPGYCAQYSRTNANGQGLTAGSWWLPSMGELMMIYANMRKINYALSLIDGATQLAETWYWSGTEFSADTAWYLAIDSGRVYNTAKASSQGRVRAVSAFLY